MHSRGEFQSANAQFGKTHFLDTLYDFVSSDNWLLDKNYLPPKWFIINHE